MVRQFPLKQRQFARENDQFSKEVSRAELGVMMGYSPSVPGSYDFLLGNGEIVPREVIEVVQVHPWDWKRRRVFKAELFPASVLPSVVGSIDASPAPFVLLPESRLSDATTVTLADAPSWSATVAPVSSSLPEEPVNVVDFNESSAPVVVSDATLDSICAPPSFAPVAFADSVISPVSSPMQLLPIADVAPPPAPSAPLLQSVGVRSSSRSAGHHAGFWKGACVASVGDNGWQLPVRRRRRRAKQASIVVSSSKSLETEWFDTRRCDEFDLDSAVSYYAPSANVASLELRPVPSTKCKEVSLSKALRKIDFEKLQRTTAVEIEKQQRIGCLGRVSFRGGELPSSCIVVRAHVLYKDKADGRETCRIAAMGDQLPVDPTAINSSSVASDDHKAFALSLMQAHCKSRGEIMSIRDFDVVGGFLRIKRTSTVPMFLYLPPNLPHGLAGSYVEVHGAIYGLRESNRLFSEEVKRVMVAAGFVAHEISPMTYVKSVHGDGNLKSVVSIHVDDFRVLDNHRPLTDELQAALVHRFEEITEHDPSESFAGVEYKVHPSGAVECSQAKYIERVASIIGVAHLPPVLMPFERDFFRASSLPDKIPYPVKSYCSLTGHLIQMLKTRDDVRHIVSHLCSKNSAPDVGDYHKALLLLRFLYSSRIIGRVFDSKSTELFGHADAAFGVRDNGCSAEAFFLTVGEFNAPFMSVARAQEDVATCPMTAEYMSGSSAAKSLAVYRVLGAALGWEQIGPSVLCVDNSTARRLAIAPEITRKSLHIHTSYHYVRQLIQRGEVSLRLVPSAEMRADVLTKYYGKTAFLKARDVLLNRSAVQVV
jgi:hypothetical protein